MVKKGNYVVYVHTNRINGKAYIGITCQIPEYRWGKNGQGYRECPHFWHAIQKYGWENFDHTVQAKNLTHEAACALERKLIADRETNDPRIGYNISNGGDGFDAELVSRQWKNESFRNYAAYRMREAWADPEKRTRRSDAAKKRWSDPNFRAYATRQVANACGRSVVCVETGEVFPLLKDVEDKLGLRKANICRAAKTGYKCGGYHWKYTDNAS